MKITVIKKSNGKVKTMAAAPGSSTSRPPPRTSRRPSTNTIKVFPSRSES